jgi:Na+-driven multidrug efflux pump
MGIPNIIFLISSIYLYYFNPVYSKIRPSLKCVERKYAREILTLGGHFFVIQVCGILLYQTANLIIIRCCGPDDVTSYNISFKYFSVITMVSGLILAPMWNAFTDAYTRSDYDWMKNTLKRLHRLFALGCVGAVIMCALSSYVYSIWLGDSVHISWQLSVCMMMYIIVCMWNSILSSSLNGIGKIKLSMIMCVVTIPLCIPMAVGLCRVMGSCGVVLSITLINLPFSVLGYIQLKKILAKKDNGIWSK